MKITDFLTEKTIFTDLMAQNKRELLQELVAPIAEMTGIPADTIMKVLLERERLGSTGIGQGIGIPHGKLKELTSLVMACGICRQGVSFDSLDGKPAYLFFLLLAPESNAELHLQMLAKLSKYLKMPTFRSDLINAENPAEIIKIIDQAEAGY